MCVISNSLVNSNWSPEILNLGQNRRFFVPCDLQIWRMDLKNNKAPLLCCFKLSAPFYSHQWFQSGVTVRKYSIWVKIDVFFVLCYLEIWQMTLKSNRAPVLCYFKLCDHFVGTGEFELELQSGNDQFRSKSKIFWAMWPWNLTDYLENNRAPLNTKLCASCRQMWIQTRVTVWKQLNWVLTPVTLTFDLWPWTLAREPIMSLVITHENFTMIRWWEHSEKRVTDRRTNRQTDRSVLRAAWSHLKKMRHILGIW